MVDISIIVPVYNPGDLLSISLHSALSQSNHNLTLEIIAVNDCSTDDSATVLAAIQKQDPRVKIITFSQNCGAGPARNAGLDAASGHYVVFLDPDDSYPLDALSSLLDGAKRSGCDMTRGNIIEFDTEGIGRPRDSNLSHTGLFHFSELPTLWVPWMHQQFLFNREFLNFHAIRYPALKRGQDTVMLARALAKCETICLIDSIVYHYKIGVKSHNWGASQFDNILDHFLLVREAYLGSSHKIPWLNYLNVFWNFWRHLQNGASGNFSDEEIYAFLKKSSTLFTDVDPDFYKAKTHVVFSLEPWKLLIYQLLRQKKFDLLFTILRSFVRLDDLMKDASTNNFKILNEIFGELSIANNNILDRISANN